VEGMKAIKKYLSKEPTKQGKDKMSKFEQEVKRLMECYEHLNLTMDEAKNIVRIEDEDYQTEILELMDMHKMTFEEAKSTLA
jgi:archaellum component FlaC